MNWDGTTKPPAPLELDPDHPVNKDCFLFLPMEEGVGGRIKDLVNPGIGDIQKAGIAPLNHTWGVTPDRGRAWNTYAQKNAAANNISLGADLTDYDMSYGGGVDKPCTIMYISRLNSVAASDVIDKWVSGSAQEFYAGWDASGRPRIRFFHFDNSARIGKKRNSAFSTGQSVMNVWTYDGSGAEAGIKGYEDNAVMSVASESSGSYTGMTNTTAPITFASRSNGVVTGDCRIYQVRLWHRELSFREVNELFHKPWMGCRPVGMK